MKTADDEIVLNYLYCFDMDKVVDRITMEQVLELVKTFFSDDYRRLGQGSLNQKQLLERHRTMTSTRGYKRKNILLNFILKTQYWRYFINLKGNGIPLLFSSGIFSDLVILKKTKNIYS